MEGEGEALDDDQHRHHVVNDEHLALAHAQHRHPLEGHEEEQGGNYHVQHRQAHVTCLFYFIY